MDNYIVHCPYCGAEMKPTEPHIHANKNGIGVKLQCHFYCYSCRSGAPWVDDNYTSDDECIAAAYKKAIERVRV